MVFQAFALMPWRSVRDNVGFGLRIRGIKGPEANETIQRYVDMVGLAGFEDAYLGAQPYIEIVEPPKVAVCHVQGPSGRARTLSVANACVGDHLGHGDTLGPCAR